MPDKVKIIVDAMGGDDAPKSPVAGALLAAAEKSNELDIILVGREADILNEIKGGKPSNVEIVNASEVIGMDESPTDAFRSKPDSSINVGLTLHKEGKADGFISAGNTGAVMAATTLKLGRIKGVGRPTIGSLFPTEIGKTMLFDVGASVDCKPTHLLEYGIMGSIYMSYIFKAKNPKVGLLNVGEEEGKGNEVTQEAYELMKEAKAAGKLNFIGNVEGRDILTGQIDVVVCDGFTGNIILKFAESVLGLLKTRFKGYAEKGLVNKLKMGFVRGAMRESMSDMDYQTYGGVPLLGVNGVSIIGHGKSTPLAIKNMIFRAEEVVRAGVNEEIRRRIAL